MKHPGTTAPFKDEDGRPQQGSVAEICPVVLGGHEQWVMVRGRRATAPVLILLHGGPGFPETQLFRRHNAALEEDFVVVYWEQRGAGRSFVDTLDPATMTLPQFLVDLDALVDVMRRRFGHPRVALLGHSWGTFLGAVYAHRHPDKVSVYAGSGQLSDWAESERASYAIALERAAAAGADDVLEKLRAIGPPPHSADALWTERTCLQQLAGHLDARGLWDLGKTFLSSSELSVLDVPRLVAGFRWSLAQMWDDVSRLSLIEHAPRLACPVVLLLGRDDTWVPPAISLDWLQAVDAPAKEVVWFDGAGHQPFVDAPDRFNEAVRTRVAPLAA
jgi:pimeloyl-ACP methyl ester carboxylesterase